MPSAMSSYQRTYSTPVSAAYPTALQTNPWMHPQAATQYIVQPHAMAQMIPSGLDPNTLHFSTLMPQLTAQMSQIQLSGVSGASVCFHLFFAFFSYNQSNSLCLIHCLIYVFFLFICQTVRNWKSSRLRNTIIYTSIDTNCSTRRRCMSNISFISKLTLS